MEIVGLVSLVKLLGLFGFIGLSGLLWLAGSYCSTARTVLYLLCACARLRVYAQREYDMWKDVEKRDHLIPLALPPNLHEPQVKLSFFYPCF